MSVIHAQRPLFFIRKKNPILHVKYERNPLECENGVTIWFGQGKSPIPNLRAQKSAHAIAFLLQHAVIQPAAVSKTHYLTATKGAPKLLQSCC